MSDYVDPPSDQQPKDEPVPERFPPAEDAHFWFEATGWFWGNPEHNRGGWRRFVDAVDDFLSAYPDAGEAAAGAERQEPEHPAQGAGANGGQK